MNNHQHTFAVLLAGGGGTRLWPKSRNHSPKQFLRLTSKDSMVQLAANRLQKIVPWEKIIVVTNQLYQEEIQKQLPNIPQSNLICEPEKKDTALAMLIGALYAQSKDPEAVIINSASDHIVEDENEFIRVMNLAVQVASERQYIIAVGISPSEPNTGFGYIKAGDDLKKLNHGLSLFKVDSFTEKPNLPTAIGYISTGKYFWNANMYVWSAQAITAAFKKHMPQMYHDTSKLATMNQKQFHQALPDIYKKSEKISIDYAISEKADNLALIPGDFGWNDVGYWKVVYDLGKKNTQGNVVINDEKDLHTTTIRSHGNLIHTNNRLVALLDVKDMIVIDTDEILLVTTKKKSQDIKLLIEQLKKEKKEQYL